MRFSWNLFTLFNISFIYDLHTCLNLTMSGSPCFCLYSFMLARSGCWLFRWMTHEEKKEKSLGGRSGHSLHSITVWRKYPERGFLVELDGCCISMSVLPLSSSVFSFLCFLEVISSVFLFLTILLLAWCLQHKYIWNLV